MKKLLTTLCILALALVCILVLPTEAKAATSGDYTYSVSDGKATITDYTGIGGDITIPSTLGGYPVTCIGAYAFGSYHSLTSVTIPDSVTTIVDYAFYYCSNLTSVTVGNSVTTIGTYAFSCCYSLAGIWVNESNSNYSSDERGVLFNKSKTHLIQAPGGISHTYTIPDSVISIGDCAFQSCTSLTSVTIEDSVTTIGKEAFRSCDSLTSVTIGNSVTTFGDYAFSNCSSLTGIWVSESNPNYSSDERGVLFNKSKTHLIQAPGGISRAYTIPDSTTSIGRLAFSYCNKLTSVTIGDSVTNIGKDAFRNCRYLTSVTMGDSVTTIGEYAFYFCDRLTGITIGDSATTIGNWAFFQCSGLTRLTIGNSVTTIGSYAFQSCTSLTNVTIPDSVTTIGNDAFRNCNKMTSLTIGDGVTTIGQYAFYYCTKLTNITIGNGITTIGNSAFYDCSRLTDVFYDGTEEQWKAIRIGSYNDPIRNANIHCAAYQASNGDETFVTLQDAFDAYEDGIIQLQADAESVTISKNAAVDLNGFSIASVTATAGELTVLDSKTADYTVADGDYGKIAAIAGTVTPKMDYVAITEEDGTSYHRVSLEITSMTLRSADMGIYYDCTFNGDEMVAAEVTSYGVAMSVRGIPTIGALGTQHSIFTEFATGANATSTLLKNVLKETYTTAQNNRNANMQVYGRAYVRIGDCYIYGETVSRSFREQVELADADWNTLSAQQQTAVQEMYRIFRESMEAWTIPNIKSSI